MSASPAITVAIPVWNRVKLVRTALDSALRQAADDLEILVVDNASTDGTWEMLQQMRDPRLRLVRNDRNVGLFGNFNRCLTLARGRYVCTLCSDDALLDGFLEPARDVLDQYPDVSVVSSRGRARVEDTGRVKPLGAVLPAGLYAAEDGAVAALWAYVTAYVNPFNYPSGILLRADVARAAGLMDESYAYSSDVQLYLRMLASTRLAILDVPGCEVLLHREQEGDKIYRDDRFLREFVAHFERHRALLERRRLASYVHDHVGGYLLGSRMKLHRSGHEVAAAACLALLREGRHSRGRALIAGLDSLRRRRAMRRGPLAPPVPVAPLPASAEAILRPGDAA